MVTHCLTDLIGPHTKVIIWVTDKSLDPSNDLFEDFNYLLDGLLTMDLTKNSHAQEHTHLYASKNFGENFYLFRVHPNNLKNIKEDVEKKFANDVNAQALLIVDRDLTDQAEQFKKNFSKVPNLTKFSTKDLVERV